MPRPTLTVVLSMATGLSPISPSFPTGSPSEDHNGLVRVRSPLLTESRLMSFPPGTEMFQFPGFALLTLYIQAKSTCVILRMNGFLSAFTQVNASASLRASTTGVPGWPIAQPAQNRTTKECQVGFPIRKSADQRVLSPPHGLSQSATSFIASYRQGIHQTPFMRLIRSSKRRIRMQRSDH